MSAEFVDHFTLAEVAERLRVSQKTVSRRIREAENAGYGPFARPGRAYLPTESDYQILLEAIRKCRSRSFPQQRKGSPYYLVRGTIDGREREVSKRLLGNLRKTYSANCSRVVRQSPAR